MRILWALASVLSLSLADLPSCERATCSHCNVEFIARMCEKACSACPRTGATIRTGNRLHYEQARAPLPTTITKPVRQDVGQFSTINVARQAGVPTQTHQQLFVYNPAPAQLPRPVQYAAPQSQAAPALMYPAGVSTLAPLIPPPRPIDIGRNLAPADLAQPLPEYQQSSSHALIPLNQIQTTQVQAPVQQHLQQQQFYNNPGTYQQPGSTDLFGRPLFSQPSQTPFHQTQYAQSNALLNPFQPFLQQSGNGGAQSLLDPFGLFNLAGMTNLAQGTTLTQVAPSASGYTSQQFARPISAAPQPQQAAQSGQQTLAPPYYNQQQQVASVQQSATVLQQPVSNYQAQQQYQVYQNQQPVYTSQNANNPRQQVTPPSASLANQQYHTNQAPVPQQQYSHNQVAFVPQRSENIDPAPVNVQKFVDGKGPAPAALPQQCPRQPGWAPCIPKEAANQRFVSCCSRLGEGCTPLCNYDAPLSTMQLAVLTGRCPLNKMADIMVCASGYEDATACCEAYNVFEPGYEQCRPYCNPAAGLPQGGLLSEKYKCLAKLSTIQQCFYVSQKP